MRITVSACVRSLGENFLFLELHGQELVRNNTTFFHGKDEIMGCRYHVALEVDHRWDFFAYAERHMAQVVLVPVRWQRPLRQGRLDLIGTTMKITIRWHYGQVRLDRVG